MSTTYPAVATAFRRYFVWTQIVVVFLLLELAIWASTVEIRNRWAAISGITILVLVVTDLLMDQSGSLRPLGSLRASFYRLGLGSPKVADTGVVLGIGLATLLFMMIFVRSLGGQIPANPTWFPESAVNLGIRGLVLDSGIHSAVVFLQPLRRTVWRPGGGLDRRNAVCRRPLAQSYPHDCHADRGSFFLRRVPPLPQRLSPRDRPRDAGTHHRSHCARELVAPHARGDRISAVLGLALASDRPALKLPAGCWRYTNPN